MSTGRQARDYLFVEDLAEALVRLVGHDAPMPETINFAGPEEHSLLDIATIAVARAGSKTPICTGVRSENPGDRPIFLGDTGLARKSLAWQPTHGLRSGLEKTVDWYRGHRNLWETKT
jgi:nucleoside-diphosphate-sugar epimerase